MKPYVRQRNDVYFLLCSGYSKDINLVKTVFNLRATNSITEKSGDIVGVYVKDRNLVSDKFIDIFHGLSKQADRLWLATNMDDIAKSVTDHTNVEMQRKESSAQDAMVKDDRMLEPKDPTKYFIFRNVTGRLSELAMVTGKIHTFSQQEETDRVETFKKKYLNTAIDLLKAIKVMFPRESHMKFVDTLKNLSVKPFKPEL